MIVKHICIVGGGSAGWMTAFALMKAKPEIKVTLIESPDIPTIGVGESLLQHFQEYAMVTGLEDQSWMSACDATYKTSIRFENWRSTPDAFQYPFGEFNIPNYENKLQNIIDLYVLTEMYPEITSREYFLYLNGPAWLAEYNRLSDNKIFLPQEKASLSYHMDATKFAIWLSEQCKKHVERIQATVDYVHITENGVEYVQYGDQKLEADLFVDCTGFKSLMIGDERLTGYQQFAKFNELVNDSAIAARIPYETEEEQKALKNYTNCKTMSAGWIWDIPLWQRTGRGYVYSSQYIDKDDAELEFRKETGWEGDVSYISFTHGCQLEFMKKNVIAVGLSAGFIEPLESTGLLSTHEAILLLLYALDLNGNDNYWDDMTAPHFTNDFFEIFCGFAEFVHAHYTLASRNDTEYWQKFKKIYANRNQTAETQPQSASFVKGGITLHPMNTYTLLAQEFSNVNWSAQNEINRTGSGPILSTGVLSITFGMGKRVSSVLRQLKGLQKSYGKSTFFGPNTKPYLDWLMTDGYTGFRNYLQYREMQIMREKTSYEYLKENIYNENL